jgi:L-asparagine oxygenase
MADRDELWSMELDEAARRRLAAAVLSHRGPVETPVFLAFSIDALRRCAPTEMLDALRRLERGTSHVGVWIRGLPVDEDLPPTPMRATAGKRTCVSEAVVMGTAGELGDPVAYRHEKEGELVQNVFPLPEERASPSNSSWEVDLDLHTEVAYIRDAPRWDTYDSSPDFLLLFCLRAAPRADAFTRVISADTLLKRVTAGQRRILEMRRFRLRAPYSFTRAEGVERRWSDPVALVHDGGTIAFDLACGTQAVDADAQCALEALREAARDPAAGHVVALQAGDLLALDNRRAAHGRSAYSAAAADGSNRWLQRIYVRRNHGANAQIRVA